MSTRIAFAVARTQEGEKVAEHFGHCEKFNICEIADDKTITAKESYFNPLTGEHGGTCQLPGYLSQFKIDTVIAGGMGQRAATNFQGLGIEVITAPGLEYDQALNLYIEGKLSGFDACKHEHHEHHGSHGHHHHNGPQADH